MDVDIGYVYVDVDAVGAAECLTVNRYWASCRQLLLVDGSSPPLIALQLAARHKGQRQAQNETVKSISRAVKGELFEACPSGQPSRCAQDPLVLLRASLETIFEHRVRLLSCQLQHVVAAIVQDAMQRSFENALVFRGSHSYADGSRPSRWDDD